MGKISYLFRKKKPPKVEIVNERTIEHFEREEPNVRDTDRKIIGTSTIKSIRRNSEESTGDN